MKICQVFEIVLDKIKIKKMFAFIFTAVINSSQKPKYKSLVVDVRRPEH